MRTDICTLLPRYTDQEFDEAFIDGLRGFCRNYIREEGAATLGDMVEALRVQVWPPGFPALMKQHSARRQPCSPLSAPTAVVLPICSPCSTSCSPCLCAFTAQATWPPKAVLLVFQGLLPCLLEQMLRSQVQQSAGAAAVDSLYSRWYGIR